MKILQLTSHYSPNVGGVETHLNDLVRLLSGNHNVFVLTYSPLTTKIRAKIYESKKNVEVLRVPWISGLFYKLVSYPLLEFFYLFPGLFIFTPLVLLFSRRDVIHGHGLIAGAVAVFWGKIFSIRTVLSTHNIYHFPKTGLYRLLSLLIFNSADEVLTLSKQSEDEIKNLGVNSKKIHTFTYWIDLNKFKYIKGAEKELGWEDKFVVLFVGRLVREKGIPELLKALKMWNKNIYLAVVGTGPMADEIKRKTKIFNNLIYLGRINNDRLPQYYSAADLVIVPSTHEEGFGRVILEALACKTPVIGSKRGAIPDAMNESVGRLIDVSDSNIKKSVENLYKNPEILNNLRKNTRIFAELRYSQKNADVIIETYKKNRMKFENSSVGILTHIYTTGPAIRLRNYLLNKEVDRLVFIGNPFNYAKDTRSFYEEYRGKSIVKRRYFIKWSGTELLFYLKDFVVSVIWGIMAPKINILITFDGFSAFIGYILKLLGKVDFLIFYTIDYVPERTPIKLLNRMYHFIDKFSVINSDLVWNVSDRIISARMEAGIADRFSSKQVEVPIGIEKYSSPRSLTVTERKNICFLGHLREGQGLEKLIRIMPSVIKEVPQVKLLIIGGGPLESELKSMVKKLNLDKYIKFAGYLENFLDVEKLLSGCAIGVAPYDMNESTFSRFADPSKVKDYLASGLPVVITKVPHIAMTVNDQKCGIAVGNSDNDLVKALVILLTNDNIWKKYRTNAYRFVKQYSMDNIFSNAFNDVFNRL